MIKSRINDLVYVFIMHNIIFFLSLFLCAGITIASFCYLQFFPPPYDVDGISFIFTDSNIVVTCYCLFGSIIGCDMNIYKEGSTHLLISTPSEILRK